MGVSLVGAGSTFFGFEIEFRKDFSDAVAAFSWYGAVALLLRMAQTAALVFWIALLGCAEKGWAGVAMVLSVLYIGGMVLEAASRSEKLQTTFAALCLSLVHLALVGFMAAVFFGSELLAEEAHGWAGAILLFGLLIACGGCLFADSGPFDFDVSTKIAMLGCGLLFVPIAGRGVAEIFVLRADGWLGTAVLLMIAVSGFLCSLVVGSGAKDLATTISSLCCALLFVPLMVAGMAMLFFDVDHVDNNYANKSLPIGGPGDPQYFDCRERTAGIGVAYLATVLCGVFTPLYAALDPQFGVMRGASWHDKLAEARRKVQTEAIKQEAEAIIPFNGQVEALCQWAERHGQTDGTESSDDDDRMRLIPFEVAASVARRADMELSEFCDLFGASQTRSGSDLQVTVKVKDLRRRLKSKAWRQRTRAMYLGLLYETNESLREKAKAAVFDAKVIAVWEWSDHLSDGELGPTELTRLADRVGYSVVVALGLQEPPAPGSPVRHKGSSGEAITHPSMGARAQLHIQLAGKEADELVDLDELECDIDEGVRVDMDTFVAACRAQPAKTEEWFEKLGLELEQKRGSRSDICACCGWCT